MASTAATKSPRIIIVGAGISGLAAAERLLKHGYSNLVILEAADRIGGRICTKNLGNGWVEMGAQWIHGEDDNSVYEYALKHNLVDDAKSEIDLIYDSFRMDDGIAVDNSLVGRVYEVFRSQLYDCRKGSSNFDERMTVEAHLDAAFQEEFDSSNCAEERAQKKALLQWCKYFQCSIDGCDSLSELSLKSFLQYKECQGNPLVNFKKGYSTLVESFARKIPPNVICLLKPVVLIKQTVPPGTGTTSYGRNCAVQVVCEDGSCHNADHVIVSTSLGCLKHNASTMFSPPLSAEKLEVIKKVGFGTVDKIFIEFERPFWPKDSSGYSLVWRSSHAKEESSHQWYKAIFGLYTVPFATNVLCGWIGGAEARHMESLSDVEVQETCVRILQQFTGKADLPAVKSILRSSWQSNPYTRGSYSYLTTDQCSNSSLAEPVTVTYENRQCPIILFAGEATHPHYYSTVHGAMETGWREADRIISYHSVSTKSNL